QHKLTPRRRRVKAKGRDKSRNHAPSHPAMRVTHHNNNWVGAVNNNQKKRKKRSAPRRAPFLTLPQSPLLLFPLLSPSQARHAQSNTRPSQHRQFVMRSRCAATSCRLSSTIRSSTPNAYWRTCSMRWNHMRIRLAVMHCISLSSLYMKQTLKSSQYTAWELREAAERCHFCERTQCAETTATLTHSTLPHTRAVPWRREARRTAHAEGHTQ
ncbi:hypothetical protein TcCL_Unassigned02843, partial [Trypanosoma cruzi]